MTNLVNMALEGRFKLQFDHVEVTINVTIKSLFVRQDIHLPQTESHYFVSFFVNIKPDNASKDEVGGEEVLQCLKLLVATIQARTQDSALKSDLVSRGKGGESEAMESKRKNHH
jgi:hypothetical protein